MQENKTEIKPDPKYDDLDPVFDKGADREIKINGYLIQEFETRYGCKVFVDRQLLRSGISYEEALRYCSKFPKKGDC
jgi:hypothetical protein